MVVSFILTVRDVIEWRARAVSDLTSSALMIGSNAAPALLFDDRKAASETLSALSAKPNIVQAVIYDQQGKVFAIYKTPSHPYEFLPGSTSGKYQFTFDQLIISKPIHFRNDVLGSISLESDLQDLYAGVLRGMGLMLITGLCVFLLAALLFNKLQKIFVTPILDMASVMQRVIEEQNFSMRVIPQGKDEIGMLVRMLNSMLERIQIRDIELADHQYHLEEKIAQRTGELHAANKLLEGKLIERKLAEADLRIAATAFESMEGMIVTDANNLILRVNRAFTDTTGYTSEEVVGQNPRILSSGRHNSDFYASMWDSIQTTGGWDGEIYNKRKNGEIYPERLTITAVKDQDGGVTNFVATQTDITARKAAEDEIRNLAFYDPLTHLPNRRLLMDRLKQAMATSAHSGRKGALLFLDLDHFKDLNDTLGHGIGDLLLQQVALRLGSCVRAGDTVARLGGDEFVILLEDLGEQSGEAAAQTKAIGEKILISLNQRYLLEDYEYHNSPSIGATLFIGHAQPQEELLKQADIALYQAKNAGRNMLRFFDPQMQDAINMRTALEDKLRKALEGRQFHLYYQIQVDNFRHSLGAEALIRWAHPERGLVSPLQFIPLAEKMGLILPIGIWVLEEACAQLKAWQNEEITCNLVLAVNVSAKQFLQPDFVAQMRRILIKSGAQPCLLKLELTESMLLDNIENTIATMSELKEIGIQFSLDDFGIGYSSLQYLKRLPLNQLKIDQSFVRDIALDDNDQAIVRTIIAMAHSLSLDVIAEGVETEDQRQLLLENGCTHFQGYLFGKPLPIDQFEDLLKQA